MIRQKYIIVLIVLFSFTLLHAQISDKFTNLQVLPKDISKEKLTETMKFFTSSLGVRCNFCHVGEDGQPLSTFDFVSDTKATKSIARTMIEMTQEINSNYISEVSELSEHKVGVTCITCHHGISMPVPLEDLLFNKTKSDGLDNAISAYDSLNKRYYGSNAYDFSDKSMMALSQKLSDNNMFDEAIEFAKINIEKYPKSGFAYFALAEAYEKKGDKENALYYYKKALEIMPNGRHFINRKIEELSK